MYRKFIPKSPSEIGRFQKNYNPDKLNSSKINRFYDVRGCEGLDSAIKSCLATKGILKKELSLQQLFKNYCQVLDEQAFQGKPLYFFENLDIN